MAMMNPLGPVSGRFQPRPALTPSEVRSVVFTTTRMRLGYDVEEVDAFLDQVEWSMEQLLHEIALLRQQLMVADRNNEARIAEVRQSLEHLLGRLGGMPVVAAQAAVQGGLGYAPAVGAAPFASHQRPAEALGRRAADPYGQAPVFEAPSQFAQAPVYEAPSQYGQAPVYEEPGPYVQAPAYQAPREYPQPPAYQAPRDYSSPQAPRAYSQGPTYTVTDAAAPPLRPPTGPAAGGPPPSQRPTRPEAPFGPAPTGGPVTDGPTGRPFNAAPTGRPVNVAAAGGPVAAQAGPASGGVPPAGPAVNLPPPSAA